MKVQILWFQLLKCEFVLVSLLFGDSKLNILALMTNKQTFEDNIFKNVWRN